MQLPRQRIRYAAQAARVWTAILLGYAIMLLGMVGPTLAIVHFYYEPLCQHFAEERGAVYWSYEGSNRKNPKRCNADGATVTVVALGGPTAVALTIVHDFFPPLGMVLGLIAGALLWQRISALLDWLISARRRTRNRQRGRRV